MNKNTLKVLALAAASYLPAVASTTLSTDTLSACIDDRGRLQSLKGADGRELVASVPDELFRLVFCKDGEFTNTVTVGASDAKDMSVKKVGDAAKLVFTDVGPAAKVVCDVRPSAAQDALAWRIAVETKPGYRLTEETFPRLALAATIGESSNDDRLVTGFNKGGVWHRPAIGEPGKTLVRAVQPGGLAAQFAAYYDARGGFWSAADDAEGWKKTLEVRREEGRLVVSWTRQASETGSGKRPFSILSAFFTGPRGKATVWQDAADRYRRLVKGRPWCRTPLAKRTDLPAWMKDAPVMTQFRRDWVEHPETIVRWMEDYWKREFGAMPLVASMWGWEKVGNWVSPDYFPANTGDDAIRRLNAQLRSFDAHPFAWPSGYHWTLWCGRRDDGTYRFDGRQAFEAKAAVHACRNADGSYYRRLTGWFPGGLGELSCLCGGDAWTIDFFNREVGAPLTRLGFEMIQVDQVVGGGYPSCWSTTHGHAPGGGTWMANDFRRQLETLAEKMRANGAKMPVLGYEEPNELFNDLVGIQDFRDTETPAEEWASVFNYLYHEYVPCFQSNPSRGDRRSHAYCAANGMLPFMMPATNDYTKVRNECYTSFMKRWTAFYHGEGRDFVAHGRHIRPPELACPKIDGLKEGRLMPAVFHGAFESLDGRRALVLANATPYHQAVSFETDAGRREVSVPADGLVLVRLDENDVARFDPRMKIPEPVVEKGIKWIDGRLLPIEGRAFDDVEHYYDRLPVGVTTNVNEGVRKMKRQTTGMMFRFATDSKRLHFRWKPYYEKLAMGHMPSTGVSGIDVYARAKGESEWRYVKTGIPQEETKSGSLSVGWTPGSECLVNLPLYNGVRDFSLGIDEKAEIGRARPHEGAAKPVVFYGTSITHGGCASRPGMSFVNIIGRRLDVPVVNLGFSGCGYMEFEMSEHLARIDASCYVLDCLWNMGCSTAYNCPGRNVDKVYEPFIRNLRRLRPDVPIVMAAQSCVYGSKGGDKDKFVKDLYGRLVAEGWKNLVYVPREGMYADDTEGTVDGIHPNDWGMMHMARAYGEAVRSALK